MNRRIRNVLLILMTVLLLASFTACADGDSTKNNGTLQVETIPFMPTAYLNESFDLRDVIVMEDGVDYSAVVKYTTVTRNKETGSYEINKSELPVEDLCFTPVEVAENMVTLTAKRGKETASKVVIIPTTIRADTLDDLLKSEGKYGISDAGISKTVNNDPAYIHGENSQTSLYVNFNGTDPHPWGNTFIQLGESEVQRHLSDSTWKNAILTFWVYNPNDKAIEFQLRIADSISGVNLDWQNIDGPNRQVALPNQWTQVFFPLRKLGITTPVVKTQYNVDALNIKFRYEDYSTENSYSFDFYVDDLDVVDASMYPEIDTKYVLSDETLDQGWENMPMDIGWQGVYTEYDYENVQGDGSTCSLKAYFNNDKALTNSFICLSPQSVEELNGKLDMTGGKLSAYFKFENMDARVSLDIVNQQWTTSNAVDFKLTPVGDGWYLGEVDLEDVQVGTGRNDQIIRIRLNFHGVTKNSVVYVDTCKFDYKYVHKVLEEVSADWINMVADTGSAYYYTVKSDFVTTHLKGSNTVRSLKLVAPAGDQGRYTWNTAAAAENKEISAMPNMKKGTIGAWFYFDDQIPEAYFFVTNDQWHSSNWIDVIFTQNAGDGWYYGEVNASGFVCAEGGGTSKISRLALVIPAGSTVYVDNLSWKSGVEKELVSANVPKPGSGKYPFQGGKDTQISLNLEQPISELSFEYVVESGKEFNIALMLPDWSEYFGYYAFNAEGSVDPYDGVTCRVTEGGVMKVTFDMKELTRYTGKPTRIIDFIYVRGDWTDASGYISNVTYTIDNSPDADKPVGPSGEGEYSIRAGEHLTVDFEAVENLKTFSFEYQIGGGVFNMALMMPGWESYYGYFAFDANGNVDPYTGVSVEKLDDGYIRVIFDMATLNKTVGTPNTGFTMLYVRGDWTEATGILRNIGFDQYAPGEQPEEPTEPGEPSEPTEPVDPQGYAFTANQDKTIELTNTQELDTLTFDYQITSGQKLTLALMPNWENNFGYYDLPVDENTIPGVTSEILDNGYTRVTFKMSELTKINGTPSTAITMIYIRGIWTDASGVIDNISWTVKTEEPTEPSDPTEPSEPSEPTEPTVPSEPVVEEYQVTPGKDLTIEVKSEKELHSISLEYQVSGTFNMALMMPGWESYYGYFAFDQHGNVDPYDGVTVEQLNDGYIRVFFDITALTKKVGTPNGGFDLVFIRGDWTDARGVIRNVVLNAPVGGDEPTEPSEPTEQKYSFEAGKDTTIELTNSQELDTLTFDYQITSGQKLTLALMPNWESNFGYYDLPVDENTIPGVTSEILDNGYTRVTFKLSELTKINGTPSTTITMLYIRGIWTDASGRIENITWTVAAEEQPDQVVEGSAISANRDATILLDNTKQLSKITFEYKLESGSKFNIALMLNWESYFGYFEFDSTGPVDAYQGITSETLANGNVLVTLDLTAITKVNGAPSTNIEFIYVRGDWTDANGQISNIGLYWDDVQPKTKSPTLLKVADKQISFLQLKNWWEVLREALNSNEQ